MDQLPPATPPRDRLSSLPEPIVVEILSLLPTKTAVSTSVLSTHWRSLWTQITSIHLDYNHFPQHSSDFYTIVNHLLLTQLTSPVLRSFYLHAPFPRHQHLESWLRHLSARKVEIIDINVEVPSSRGDTTPGPPFSVPLCIFRTQSLVCLNFRLCRLEYDLPLDPHVVIYLPNLKKLCLSLNASQCRFLSQLLRSCPLLEDLSLSAAERRHGLIVFDDANTGALIAISSGTLKRLELVLSLMTVKVLIDTPKLEWFSLFGFRMDCCFVKKPIALSEATIITAFPELVAPLMPMLLDIRVLHIHGLTLEMFEGLKDDNGNLLFFRNLDELNLQLSTAKVDELKIPPFNSHSSCLLYHVKKINVVVVRAEHGLNLMNLAHYFLGSAPSLERLSFVLKPQTTRQSADELIFRLNEMVFCMDLYWCSQNSPECLIEFEGQYAKVPANIAELHEMENLVQLLSALHDSAYTL